ncbi:MAG: VCBS repeat-containing protein, partial [Legionellales bacterium]
HEQLQEQKDLVAIFQRDVIYHLILLSGQQLSGERLLNRLKNYQGLVDESDWNAVYKAFQELITTHFAEGDLNPYQVKDIPNAAYTKVIATLERTITVTNGNNGQPWLTSLKQIISQGYHSLKSHPYQVVTATFIASMGYLYGRDSTAPGIQLYTNNGQFGVNSLPWQGLATSMLLPISIGASYPSHSHSNKWMSVATLGLLSEIASYLPVSRAQLFNASLNLSSLNGTNGFIVNGINSADYASGSISSGDFNGDGIADLLIGAFGAPSNSFMGQSYVVYGRNATLPATFN